MKRFLLITSVLFLLVSGISSATSVHTTIFLDPNDGSGGNFAAFQKGQGFQAALFGGLPYFFYNFGPYAPGDTLGGVTDLFVSSAFAKIGNKSYELSPAGLGTVFLSSFDFPTNGKSFTVPVTVDFFAPFTIVDTGEDFVLGGSATGKMRFDFFDGFYEPNGGFISATVPEPSTLALTGIGFITLLTSTVKRAFFRR